MHGALKNARDYLRQLASTIMDDSDYAEISTTTETIRKRETQNKVEVKIEDIGSVRETATQGVVIEELTTTAVTSILEKATTLSQKEVLQMGMKILEEHYQMLKGNISMSTYAREWESTTVNSNIRTTRYIERFRIVKNDAPADDSQRTLRIVNITQAPDATNFRRATDSLTAAAIAKNKTRQVGPHYS